MYPTEDLARSPLFRTHTEGLPLAERVSLSYKRARAIADAYRLTTEDLLALSEKFWKLHTDPIWSMDGAAGTLMTLQYNCCAGTLAMFVSKQPHLKSILDQVLSYDISGQFCLTEVGHGLDAIHLETTATLLPNNNFDLHTPHERAAKYMPPTTPVGIPCIAVVFARTIIAGEDRGIKPFVVALHDGRVMHEGISCRLLPHRGGSRPLNHALTYFNHVQLTSDALLGSPDRPADFRASFFINISRVAIGTIAIGSLGVPALRVAAFIAARYSLRRTIVDHEGKNRPIISFRTQQTPIVSALAQSFVMQAMHDRVVTIFRDASLDPRVRHAMAAILKITMIRLAQDAHLTLGDRCGAQGLFEVNQLSGMFADMRGTAIAEGDLLALSIRLATELLLERYAVPSTSDPTSLFARHEAGLFDELRTTLAGIPHHRSIEFDRRILPHARELVQAIGHRIAYDAAVEAGVDHCLIDMFVSSCVKLDRAWYVECAGLTRAAMDQMEDAAVGAVYARLEEYLGRTGVEPYISAPLVSEEKWVEYLGTMDTYTSLNSTEVQRNLSLAANTREGDQRHVRKAVRPIRRASPRIPSFVLAASGRCRRTGNPRLPPPSPSSGQDQKSHEERPGRQADDRGGRCVFPGGFVRVRSPNSRAAPVVFCKACEIFIAEITARAFIVADSNKRRTLSRQDIAKALSKSDQFDFLIDIVPREEPFSVAGKSAKKAAGPSGSKAGRNQKQANEAASGPPSESADSSPAVVEQLHSLLSSPALDQPPQ